MISTALQALVAASACAAGIDVHSSGERTYNIEAKGAQVSSVLECLSDRVGFKLVMDSSVSLPQAITLSLQDRTATQSVSTLLENLPINFALSSDASGGKILMLLITPRSGGSGSSSSSGGSQGPALSPGGRPDMRRPAPPPEPRYDPNQDDPAGPPPVFMTPPPPLYPEPTPLSPYSLRGSGQIHVADAKPHKKLDRGKPTILR